MVKLYSNTLHIYFNLLPPFAFSAVESGKRHTELPVSPEGRGGHVTIPGQWEVGERVWGSNTEESAKVNA